MTTDAAILPHYRNRPVPWVTRWSTELVDGRHDVMVHRREDGRLWLGYHDTGSENRDRFGVLWQKEGLAQGKGEPLWKAVNTYRQRACMTRSKCQVCGRTIEDKVTPWLMPLDALQWVEHLSSPEPQAVTSNGPTCAGCVPLALDLCPALKINGWKLYHVLDWGVWGVRGMHHYMQDGSVRRKPALIPYDLTGYEDSPVGEGAVLAQQMVVVWNKFVLHKQHVPKKEEADVQLASTQD